MKREIKFRGKRLDNGQWVYGDLLHIVGGCVIYHGSQTESDLIEDRPNLAVELYMDEVSPVDLDTVGQFTGLFDSNGMEIYEGDILRISISKDGIAEVRWNTKCAMLVEQMKNSSQWYNLEGRKEIIGNIYDNPDLLKGGNQ